MLDISKLKILENKRFVCLVRFKILKVLYIMMTKETKGHRDAAVSILTAENSNKTNRQRAKTCGHIKSRGKIVGFRLKINRSQSLFHLPYDRD